MTSRVVHPIIVTLKGQLKAIMDEQGVSRAEMATRLGCGATQVTRLLDPAHNTPLSSLEAAAKVLGHGLVASATYT